jgi:hypothetical protein
LQVETVNCIWSAAVPVEADQKPGYVCLDFTAFFAALVFRRRTTGLGVLENYAVLPTKTHHLHLLFSPYPAPGGLDR